MPHSAVLLIDCPDRRGLVARVSSLLYERGANILHADQHRDQVEDLVARGRDLERTVLARALRWRLERRILCYGNITVVFD